MASHYPGVRYGIGKGNHSGIPKRLQRGAVLQPGDQAESEGVLLMFHILASSSTTIDVRSAPPSSAVPLHAELRSLIGLPPFGDLMAHVPFVSA